MLLHCEYCDVRELFVEIGPCPIGIAGTEEIADGSGRLPASAPPPDTGAVWEIAEGMLLMEDPREALLLCTPCPPVCNAVPVEEARLLRDVVVDTPADSCAPVEDPELYGIEIPVPVPAPPVWMRED